MSSQVKTDNIFIVYSLTDPLFETKVQILNFKEPLKNKSVLKNFTSSLLLLIAPYPFLNLG